MIRQYDAQLICDKLLHTYPTSGTSLWDQGWRTNFTKATNFMAQCQYDAKRIVYSLNFLHSISEIEAREMALHEIAHALCPGHAHNDVWKAKAIELGIEPRICGRVSLSASREVMAVEQKEKKKLVSHQVQKKCPTCGKVAVHASEIHLPSGATWIKLECGHLVKKEALQSTSGYTEYGSINGALKAFKYQLEGLDFIVKNNGRVLIADEPGLGKTIQAIGFIRYFSQQACPVLWMCKSTLTLQATKEFLIWAGIEFFPQVIISSKNFIIPGMKVYVISMDLLRRMPREKLEAMNIKTVIADEVQAFKNPDSSRTAELRALVNKADFFIALSGTPWKNRSSEYFTILNMLSPEKFPSKRKFIDQWVEMQYDPKTGKMKEGGILNIQKFREYTKDLVIRRMRDDVLPDLPKINRQIRFVDMDKYKELYDKEESSVANAIKDALLEGGNVANLAAEMMRLKHITGIAKAVPALEDTIEFLENTEPWQKIVIGVHHHDVANILENGDPFDKTIKGLNSWLAENGYHKCLSIDSRSRPDQRQITVDKFKSDILSRVMILGTLSGGEGLNLQFVTSIAQLERQWNRANEQQFEFRFSRPLNWNDYPAYLQEHLFTEDRKPKITSIRIPYYIAADTIDEMLTDIVARKEVNFKRTMDVGSEDLKFEDDDVIRELAEMIVKKKFGEKKK